MLMCEGVEQISLFGQGTVSGKTSAEPCPQTVAKTSKQSSRSSSALRTRMPLPFHYLTKANGKNGGGTWEPDPTVGGSLPIGFTTLNIGECRSAGNVSAYSLTTEDGRPTGYCLTLSTGEKPKYPIPTKLSQILEDNPNPKYNLSAKACQGILNRANRRGKKLPEALEKALIIQSRGGG